MEEAKKSIKIDSYDFFGYLVPGFLLLGAIAAAHFQIAHERYPSIFKALAESKDYYYAILTFCVVSVLILSYILGHAIATVASFFYERMIVRRVWGYPYERLLYKAEDKEGSGKYKALASAFYVSVSLTIFLQLQLHGFAIRSSSFTVYIFAIATFPIALSVFAYSTCIGRPFARVFTFIEVRLLDIAGRGKPFPEQMKKEIERRFLKDFKISIAEAGTEVFWAVYWKVTNEFDYVRAKVDKWLVLYSFMRNVGASLLCSSFILCIANIYSDGLMIIAIHTSIILLMSLLVVARYYYLYYSYYTKSVFRAYVFLGRQSDAASLSQTRARR